MAESAHIRVSAKGSAQVYARRVREAFEDTENAVAVASVVEITGLGSAAATTAATAALLVRDGFCNTRRIQTSCVELADGRSVSQLKIELDARCLLPRCTRPLLIGVISDIQYADCEDGADYSGLQKRYFRNTVNVIEAAIDVFNATGVDAVVTLGDAIDGRNAKAGASKSALDDVLRVLAKSTAPARFDLVGNHELYNFTRDQLATCGLNCTDKGSFYYSKCLNARWEAVLLDAYEHSIIGMTEDDPRAQEARKILHEHNPIVLDPNYTDWFEGLPLEKHRYVPFNGGISKDQVNWLRAVLDDASASDRKVLVFTHIPLLAAATQEKTTLWNAKELLDLISEYRSVVVAVVAGHDHDGGYATDTAGIHHVTLNSPLCVPPGVDCHAILECHDTWARLKCSGRACVESGTCGKGKAYTDLVLSKGAVNSPA